MNLRADDRVLMLAIPAHQELARVAELLTAAGSLVALGTRDEVDAARASLACFDNVMLIDARPDAIPWRESYFTKILVPPHRETLLRACAAELNRVLAEGGEILTERHDC